MIAETRQPSGGRGHRIEMSGSIGCLEVVGPAPDRDGQRKARWTCRCTLCGAEVTKSGTELRRGTYARCGPGCGKPEGATPTTDRPRTARAAAAVEPDWGEAERILKQRRPGDGPEAAAETGKPGLGTIVAGYLAEWRAGRNPLAPGGMAMGGGGGEEGGNDDD